MTKAPRSRAVKHLILIILLVFSITATFAHETQTVGSGDTQFDITAGFATEPPFTEERNGLDLFIRTAAEEPVENLENSVKAELTAPNGETRILSLRTVFNSPGDYTDDFVLTMPGIYTLRVYGFIGDLEVDNTFELSEVRPLSDLYFPGGE